jgi:hypothetical protein
MENYREGNKVKHRVISNISKWSESLIDTFEKTLKSETVNSITDLQLSPGKSMGALSTIFKIANMLGITKALGHQSWANWHFFRLQEGLFLKYHATIWQMNG